MKKTLSFSLWGNIYEKYFRKHAHQLIALGYEKSRYRINCELEETEITGFICKEIKEYLRLNFDPRFERYFPDEESYVEGENRTGKNRRRLDIVIQCSRSIPDFSRYLFI
jgi:hypothetical protein